MNKKLLIEGMSCNHCVKHVEEALNEIDGVISVVVSLEDKNAVIEITKDIQEEQLRESLDDAGYELVRVE